VDSEAAGIHDPQQACRRPGEMTQIQAELASGLSMSVVLLNRHFDFPYLLDVLCMIKSVQTNDRDKIEFLICVIFYRYLSFPIHFQIQCSLPHAGPLFEGLVFASKSKKSELILPCRNIVLRLIPENYKTIEFPPFSQKVLRIYPLSRARISPCKFFPSSRKKVQIVLSHNFKLSGTR
jgi:hypothetical protein